jgi:hypothetical protein
VQSGLTVKDGRIIKILAEFLSIHRRTRDEKLELRSKAGNILRQEVRTRVMKI